MLVWFFKLHGRCRISSSIRTSPSFGPIVVTRSNMCRRTNLSFGPRGLRRVDFRVNFRGHFRFANLRGVNFHERLSRLRRHPIERLWLAQVALVDNLVAARFDNSSSWRLPALLVRKLLQQLDSFDKYIHRTSAGHWWASDPRSITSSRQDMYLRTNL